MALDKTALVTGASGGIGRVFALALAREGYAVTAVARSEDKLTALMEELGEGHRYLVADLSDPQGVEVVAAELRASPYDLLVNNAGIGTYGPFHEVELDRTLAMLRLNIDALVTLSHAWLAGARAGDALINVSSTLAFMPMPTGSAYSASKSFVTAFSDGLWYENKDRGVYVMGLCPGVTYTDFHHRAGGTADSKPPDAISQTPEQVVQTALAALKRRGAATVITGIPNKAAAFMARLMPRSWLVGMMGSNAPKT